MKFPSLSILVPKAFLLFYQIIISKKLTFGLVIYTMFIVVALVVSQQIAGVQQGIQELVQSWIIWPWNIPLLGVWSIVLLFTFHGTMIGLDRFIHRSLSLSHGLILLGSMGLIIGFGINLVSSQEFLMALPVGTTDNRAYEVNKWDLVVYQIFDGIEVSRTPIDVSTNQITIPDQSIPITISFETRAFYPNAQRIDPQIIQQQPIDREPVRNTPGLILEQLKLSPNGNDNWDGQLIAEDPLVLHSLDTRPRDLVFSQILGALGLLLEPKEIQLPFSIFVESTDLLRFPGTQEVALHKTNIHLDPPGVDYVLQENTPIWFGDYRIYKSPFRFTAPDQGIFQPIIVIRITRSPFEWVVIVGLSIIILGLLIELVKTGNVKRKLIQFPKRVKGLLILGILIGFIGGIPGSVSAQVLDHQQPIVSDRDQEFSFPSDVVDTIGRLRVQYQGRFMPLERFGSLVMGNLGINQRIHGVVPKELFTLILLAPGQADTVPMFQIMDPEVFEILELPFTLPGIYSFNQLAQGFFILTSLAELLEQVLMDPSRPQDSLELEILQLYQRGTEYLRFRGALNPSSLGDLGIDPFLWQDHPLRMIPMNNRLEPTIAPDALHPLEADLLVGTPTWQILGDSEILSDLTTVMINGVNPQKPDQWVTYTETLLDLQERYFRSAFGSHDAQTILVRTNLERWLFRNQPWLIIEFLLVTAILLWIFSAIVWLQITDNSQKNLKTRKIILLDKPMMLVRRVQIIQGILILGGFAGGIGMVLVTLLILGSAAVLITSVQLVMVGTILIGFGAYEVLTTWKNNNPISVRLLVFGISSWLSLVGGQWVESFQDPFMVGPIFQTVNALSLVSQIFGLVGISSLVLGGVTAGLLLCFPSSYVQVKPRLFKPENLGGLLDKSIRVGFLCLSFGMVFKAFNGYLSQGRIWNWTLEELTFLMLILWTKVTLFSDAIWKHPLRAKQAFAVFGFLGLGFYWFGHDLFGPVRQGFSQIFLTLLGLVVVLLILSGILSLVRFSEGRKNL
jgi:hypothetical protein